MKDLQFAIIKRANKVGNRGYGNSGGVDYMKGSLSKCLRSHAKEIFNESKVK